MSQHANAVPPNRFYQAFDTERIAEKRDPDRVRSPFEVDRDRIVYSHAFRRLQSKTQVFQSGEFDFYRTRLTHSIEVSQIGRSIVNLLNIESPLLGIDFRIDSDLVEAVGLAHDLGHPPFGHLGERRLNELMGEHGGFEGNAQNLRILTRLFYSSTHSGSSANIRSMNPTRALVDGLLKYKMPFSWAYRPGDGSHPPVYPANHFVYDSDNGTVSAVIGRELESLRPADGKDLERVNRMRSIECQIMDWADDTAYSINDILDGIQAGYIHRDSIERWAGNTSLGPAETKMVSVLQDVIANAGYEYFLNRKIGDFIHAVKLVPAEPPFATSSNRYRFRLEIDPECEAESRLYKRIANELIFQSTQIQRIEFKGAHILTQLFEALVEHYGPNRSNRPLNILPEAQAHHIREATTPAEVYRSICDTLSLMTDSQAIRLYKQLYSPGFGSIIDLA